MKAILLSLAAISAFALTGCETTVVEHGHHHGGHVSVYYDSGRPYYYTGGVRYWGYPSGYGYGGGYGYRDYGYGYSRPSYHNTYSRNVEVERNTYIVNNNRRVYNNQTTYSARRPNTTYRTQTYQSSNVKVKGVPPGQAKKKKKVQYTY